MCQTNEVLGKDYFLKKASAPSIFNKIYYLCTQTEKTLYLNIHMKRISFICSFLFMFILSMQAQQAKYVFYFIGDGMGVNQVQGTEMYLSELKGEIGITPLLFTQFPYATTATTFSASNGVTDSAASPPAASDCQKSCTAGTAASWEPASQTRS